MPVLARIIFPFVQWAARKGFAHVAHAAAATDPAALDAAADAHGDVKRAARRRVGVRGETYAYWYLRRSGYVMIARNFTVPGVKGEIDLIGYDGDVLAFVEVKTRTSASAGYGLPEDAVTSAKRRNISRIAGQFLAERRLRKVPYRFDVVAIESPPDSRPAVRLHKGAFTN